NQFDTIYHEHFSYLSFLTVKKIFEAQNLEMFDVQEIPTHGGSLRIFAKHKADSTKPVSQNVLDLLRKEDEKGMNKLDYYNNFQQKAETIKMDLTSFLIDQKRAGKKVAGYGAAAKGNTLLNYCGIKNDLIEFVVDANPHKQNKWLPASHIPVVHEDALKEAKPDFVVILPWNLREEIVHQLSYIRNWNGRFVVAIPALEII
ncbi:MAG TPA: methyltransferase C-terminal domain-containing protein, partial [Flavitalea sp.]|nr:methyltransferase C-terminal domain-containing protein [Flavitalea sp.]